jgi:hypothetical protein
MIIMNELKNSLLQGELYKLIPVLVSGLKI